MNNINRITGRSCKVPSFRQRFVFHGDRKEMIQNPALNLLKYANLSIRNENTKQGN
jgi:hypothetical protein